MFSILRKVLNSYHWMIESLSNVPFYSLLQVCCLYKKSVYLFSGNLLYYLKPKINKLLHTKWQQRWNNNNHNKLFQIQPILGKWR